MHTAEVDAWCTHGHTCLCEFCDHVFPYQHVQSAAVALSASSLHVSLVFWPHITYGLSRQMLDNVLQRDVTDDDLRQHFGQYGAMEDFKIVRETPKGPKGFGFITYQDPVSMEKALIVRHVFGGRQVECKRALPKEEHYAQGGRGEHGAGAGGPAPRGTAGGAGGPGLALDGMYAGPGFAMYGGHGGPGRDGFNGGYGYGGGRHGGGFPGGGRGRGRHGGGFNSGGPMYGGGYGGGGPPPFPPDGGFGGPGGGGGRLNLSPGRGGRRGGHGDGHGYNGMQSGFVNSNGGYGSSNGGYGSSNGGFSGMAGGQGGSDGGYAGSLGGFRSQGGYGGPGVHIVCVGSPWCMACVAEHGPAWQ